MNQRDLEDLHDDLIDETHPDDTKTLLGRVLAIESVEADDNEGLLADLFEVILWSFSTGQLDEQRMPALDHIVSLGFDPVPYFGPDWKGSV